VISSLIIARQETTFLTGKSPGPHPPRKYDEPSKNYGSFNLPKFGETNYKEFDETSKSYGSFGLLKFEQTFLQGVRRAVSSVNIA